MKRFDFGAALYVLMAIIYKHYVKHVYFVYWELSPWKCVTKRNRPNLPIIALICTLQAVVSLRHREYLCLSCDRSVGGQHEPGLSSNLLLVKEKCLNSVSWSRQSLTRVSILQDPWCLQINPTPTSHQFVIANLLHRAGHKLRNMFWRG